MKIARNVICYSLGDTKGRTWAAPSDCPTVRCGGCGERISATQLLRSRYYTWAEYVCPCGATTLVCKFEASVSRIVADMKQLGKIDTALARHIETQIKVERTLFKVLRRQELAIQLGKLK